MATWSKSFIYIRQFEYASSNQHGERYKLMASKKLSKATISCKTNDAEGMKDLILLSHHLDTPVRYDFESRPQTAYINVVSAEQLVK